MSGTDEGFRRSRRIHGEDPEVFSTPLLRIRKDAKNRVDEALAAGALPVSETVIPQFTSVCSRSREPSVSSKSSAKSEARRLKINAEVESLQRLGKFEEEFLLARQRLEREKKIEEKKLEMERLQIDEEIGASSDEDVVEVHDVEPNNSEAGENERVRTWVQDQGSQRADKPEAEAQPVTVEVGISDPMLQMNARLEKLMARQAVSKDLPVFSGEPEEWPMFYQQFHRTTELCGLSDDENVIRLQKCLKGKAREAVLPILGMPESVSRVMETLELMFGRTDQIIKSMLNSVRAAPTPSKGKPENIILFSNLVRNLVATMKSLRRTGQLYNPQLLEELLLKLPIEQQFHWCGVAKRLPQEPSLENFDLWLSEVAMTASMMPTPTASSFEKQPDNKRKENKRVFVAVSQKDGKKCFHCAADGHKLEECKEFSKSDVSARWKTVKANQLCYCCLGIGHRSVDCRKKIVCGVGGCDRHHSKLLHKVTMKPEVGQEESKVECVGFNNFPKGNNEVLLRILPVKLYGPKGEFSTYAFLDDGSTVTMIHTSVAEKLGLTGAADPLCIQWTNDICCEEKCSRRVTLEISGNNESKRFRLQNTRTVSQMSLPSQTVDMESLQKVYPYLQDIPFPSMVNVKPLILIGSNNMLLMMTRKSRHGHWNDPVATKTWLGWVVHGNLPNYGRSDSSYSYHVCEKPTGNDQLTQLIRESFSTEALWVNVGKQKCSSEDQLALQLLETTTRRVGTRFETGLLWRSQEMKLPESRTSALRRLHCMERKMDRDAGFRDAYNAKMEDYIAKGYCRKLSPEEASEKGPRTYYLPHFGVFNPNKPGKLRLVFDAAARSHGVSFNDCMLKGPDLLKSLPAVIMRFRRHRIGFAGDIREMFHQIRIISADVNSQRFLWRGKDRSIEPDDYVMDVMIFGAACSPSSALFVKDANAREFEVEFPETARSVVENTYMDDYLHGADTECEAIGKVREAMDLFGRGGFPIVNWTSSSRKVVKSLQPEYRAKSLICLEEDSVLPTERILGLRWNAEIDKFVFCLKFPKVKEEILSCSRVPTKREMASLVMSVYDPLGFVVQFSIKGRILFQDAWLLKTGWDDPISEELFQRWKWWVGELRNITMVQVPRCYSPNLREASNVQLHVFVDASSKAFASVAYFRIEFPGGVDVCLVLARARVAPLKTLTIPRLELQAAVLGCRLAQTIRAEVQLPINSTVFWSDSQTVISWIRSESPCPKQFVVFRIGEILEASSVNEWRWVPTESNVADDATRCNPQIHFQPTSRWYTGPEFLLKPECDWPTRRVTTHADTEEKSCTDVVMSVTEIKLIKYVPDAHRFSSWMKLVRATAWVRRFARNWAGISVTVGELNATEFKEAEMTWWKVVQKTCFQEEIKALKKGQPVSVSSRLKFLSPFIDCDGILRVKGRTEWAEDLQLCTKQPVILDQSHKFTELLLLHLHNQSAHQGVESVLNEVRLKYWVLCARAAVKKAFRNCQWCKVRKAKPQPPEMGLLPPERLLKQVGPFAVTGVDYFGPFTVTVMRKHVKRYGVLFTCLSVRAIHLEIAPDLSTDAAINAIRRFIARRGVPEVMWSDNGTNFRGADRELREAISQIDGERIIRTLAGKGMVWKFNPPASPHFGGVWERLVKSVKVALNATLKEHSPKEDVLSTVFAEVEFIVNNRPLTHVSVDPDDPVCLTPNNFLMSKQVGSNVPGKFGESGLNLRCQWRLVQEFTEKLWSRWVREYLPTLTRRTKWCEYAKPIKVGDIVVVVDNNGPRNSWPLGRILKVYPSKDGQVRVVDVQTKDGVYKRPATKICVLDVLKSDEENDPSSGGRIVEAREDGDVRREALEQ